MIFSRSSMAGLCGLLFLQLPASAIAPAQDAGVESSGLDAALGRLGDVSVRTLAIYTDVPPEERLFPRLIEAVHWTTRDEVVRLEVWLDRGDPVTRRDLQELERKLRNTGLFAEVRVVASPPDEGGFVDVAIETRDRLSLVLGASGALVGDVGTVRANVGETNLFGRGDRITLEYEENTEGEIDGALSFTDRHLFGEWTRLNVFGRSTDEGDGVGARIWRPRRQLAEPLEWSVRGFTGRSAVDYFRGGDSVAEVPIDELDLSAFAARGFGTRESYWQAGVSLRLSETDYDAARGPLAGAIDVPGNTTTVFAGPTLRYDRTQRFEPVQRLDTLGFVQDLRLGGGAELVVGVQHRDEEGRVDRLEPLVLGRAYAAFEPLESAYVTLDVSASGRWDAGETVASATGADLHAYYLADGGHTLAASLTFDDVFEGEGLPLELTLGEDNGLRGYPSREFAGAKRLRLNLEERYDLDLTWRTLQFGCVAFADAGWIAADGEGLGEPRRSVGVGLRIGSPELFGGGVLRVDLALPLDDVDGVSYDPLLSVAIGQVFSFFGNDSVLSNR